MVIQTSSYSTPLVSVIIPTYNRCSFVQEAIDSVLAQDFKDFELIVVDDGSTDGTKDVLEKRYGEKITCIWQENQGESVARNHGISLAKGKYIAFLDSDDFWIPEKLSRQVSVLQNNLDVGAVFCQAWHVDRGGRRLDKPPLGSKSTLTDFDLNTLLMRNKIPAGASTCLIRNSLFDKVGYFSEDILYGEDWDLWIRISAFSSMILLPEPLVSYRRHIKSQRFFVNTKRVDDILIDRLTMLNRSVKKFPEKVSKKSYYKAVANQYCKASLANYYLQDAEKGKGRLEKAAKIYPDLFNDKRYFVNKVVVFAMTYAVDQDGIFSPKLCFSFVDLLSVNLPPDFCQRWGRFVRGKVRVELGFKQYHQGNLREAIRYILSGVRLAPEVIDLAVLAILVEPFVGKRFIDWLRFIRHRNSK